MICWVEVDIGRYLSIIIKKGVSLKDRVVDRAEVIKLKFIEELESSGNVFENLSIETHVKFDSYATRFTLTANNYETHIFTLKASDFLIDPLSESAKDIISIELDKFKNLSS